MEKVWYKYQQFLVGFVLDPKSTTYKYPSSLNKSEVAIIWAEVANDFVETGKFKIISKETKDFSFANIDRRTNEFLQRYNPGSVPNPEGDPTKDAKDGQKGSDGIDEGNKPNAANDATGKGGDLGFSSKGGPFNVPDINIPLWLWLLGAAAGGLWFFSTDGKKTVIKLVSGGVTVWFTLNYLNKSKIKLPFKIPGILGAIPDTQRLPKRINL